MAVFKNYERFAAKSEFDLEYFRRGRGECYANASMRKVGLILQFNFLSGSDFFSCLVRQVIIVPFVV